MDILDVSIEIDRLVEHPAYNKLDIETRRWFRDTVVIPVDTMCQKKWDAAPAKKLTSLWWGEKKLVSEMLREIEKIKIILAHR